MIADWSVEIGPDCPVMAAPWDGWIDLRTGLHFADLLPEAKQYPELKPPLLLLNGLASLTTKVDVFPMTREEADPEIRELGEAQTAYGLGSYVDVLTLRTDVFPGFADFAALAGKAAAMLNRDALPLAASEIVVRAARLYDQPTFGWTLYAMGFGADKRQARAHWADAYRTVTSCFHCEIASAVSRRPMPTRASSSIG